MTKHVHIQDITHLKVNCELFSATWKFIKLILGYWWEFKETDSKEQEDENKKVQKKGAKSKSKDETGSLFQRQRVNILLNDLARKFPLKNISIPVSSTNQLPDQKATTEENLKPEIKVEVKSEPQAGKPPPEKKARLI